MTPVDAPGTARPTAGPADDTDQHHPDHDHPGKHDHHDQDDYVRRGLAHLWIHTRQYNDLTEDGEYLVVTSGDGIWLMDASGNRYIDAMSGLWVVNAGHGRRELADVAARQMTELP